MSALGVQASYGLEHPNVARLLTLAAVSEWPAPCLEIGKRHSRATSVTRAHARALLGRCSNA
jgi:hypothetical protein